LQTAGTDATTGALSGLGQYDPTKLNNTDAITAAAGKYADGQNIDAQVNDAMLNARQTARDVTLPQIEQPAAITGTRHTSRTGLAGTGAAGDQHAQQANLDNQQAQYQSKVQAPYASLQQLMGIIGSNNWGANTTGTSTATKTPGAFDILGGLLGTAGSAATGLG